MHNSYLLYSVLTIHSYQRQSRTKIAEGERNDKTEKQSFSVFGTAEPHPIFHKDINYLLIYNKIGDYILYCLPFAVTLQPDSG